MFLLFFVSPVLTQAATVVSGNYLSNPSSSNGYFGHNSTYNSYFVWNFTPNSEYTNVNLVEATIDYIGGTGYSAYMEIYEGDVTSGGILIASSSNADMSNVASNSLPAGCTNYNANPPEQLDEECFNVQFFFDTPLTLEASQLYTLVIIKDGALDGSDFSRVYTNNNTPSEFNTTSKNCGVDYINCIDTTGLGTIRIQSDAVNLNSRIDSWTPVPDSLVATTSPVDYGAIGYVSGDDYIADHTWVDFQIQRLSCPEGCAIGGNDLIKYLQLRIDSSGSFNVASTTDLLDKEAGYTITVFLRTSRYCVLGFCPEVFFKTLDWQRGYFAFGTTTALDQITLNNLNRLEQITTNAATDEISCALNNLVDCLVQLFIPTSQDLQDLWNTTHDSILAKWPWGYVTRLLVIFSGSAETSLPSYTVSLNIGPGSDSTPETTTLFFNMQDMIAGGGALLDSIEDTRGYGVNIRDVVETPLKLFTSLSIVLIIWHDIIASRHRKGQGVAVKK